MNSIKKIFSIALVASMVLSMAACGNPAPTTSSSTPTTSGTDSKPADSSASTTASSTSSTATTEDDKGPRTENTYTEGSPKKFNPHEWELNDDNGVLGYTTSGFYGFRINADKTNYEAYCDAARELPIDVTKEYAGKGTYGIPADATNGWAVKIKLREDLCWEDGKPIKAEDYVYSMKQLFDPKMKNYRAPDRYDGALAIANARDYYYDGTEGTKKVTWEDVGIKQTGEYEFDLIFTKPSTEFYQKYNLWSTWLVNEELYEKYKEPQGDIVKTTYGTSADKYISYGPYKIAEYQLDKTMKYVKNDKWYGWTDPDYKGDLNNYETIVEQVIPEQKTALQTFLQGKLDSVGLTADDMKIYATSDYLQLTPQTYTTKLTFNTDLEALKAREVPGINKTILTYKDFRKAFSLCIDRKEYTTQCTASHIPGFGLYNELYISNPEEGTKYRDSEPAQKALLKVYGGTDASEISGYDVEAAKKLFQSAYDACLKDGNIKDGDKVEIEFLTYNGDEGTVKIVSFFQTALDTVTKGTSLEGKITIKMVPDADYYTKAKEGKSDMIMSTWGGASMNPFGLMEVYCTDKKINEYGFKPETEKIAITVDGKELTKTYFEWYDALNNKEYAAASEEIRTEILAGLEAGILETYNCIPLYYRLGGSLLSHRAVNESEDYLPIAGFGRRFITMSDAKWAEHCAAANNKLAY